jgi:phosphocarrier protein HPr
MAKSTDIKVKLSSVDEVKQFVDVMRGYHGDVDISATNKIYSWCYQSRSER